MADWERAKAEFPLVSAGKDELDRRVAENPDIIYAIIRDMYDIVKTEEEKERGFVRIGRRPRRSAASFEEVWETLFPEPYSMDPFPEAMIKLLNGRSQRQFARKVPCHQTTLSRMMAGTLEPDLTMLERIAAAAKVQPYFFVEWRALYIGGLVTRVFIEYPNLSVAAFKEVRG